MKNLLNKKIVRSIPLLLLTLVMITSAIASSVIGKYVYQSEQSIDLNIHAFGKIDISLTEGQTGTQWSASTHTLKLIPGASIKFDPYVCIKKVSESCYVFVEITENDTNNYITFSPLNTLSKGSDSTDIPTNVYYFEYTKQNTSDVTYYPIITGNAVTVSQNITQTEMADIETNPTISITVYAVQKTNLSNTATAADAWKWLQTKLSSSQT